MPTDRRTDKKYKNVADGQLCYIGVTPVSKLGGTIMASA
jgi:hypothetical protein